MENMDGILDLLKVCLWLGLIIVCVALIVSGILRWLASSEKRTGRLNIAGWIAFAILTVMFFYNQRTSVASFFANGDGSKTLTFVVINGSKMTAKLLLLGAVFSIATIILLVFIILLSKGIRAAFYAKNTEVKDWAKIVKEKGNQFGVIVRTPVFTFFVTCGILLVFIILPLLLGTPKGEMGLAETWIDGVQTFASAINRNEYVEKGLTLNAGESADSGGDIDLNRNIDKTRPPLPEAVITYMLVYVIVLGVGFSIARILYAIVKDNLNQKQTATLIDEYSSSMGVLGVGVSILLVLQDDELNIYQDDLFKILGGFFKYFVIVAIVMALAIVILEVIRLVMDMRETLIRKEAKYLFVALVGRAALLILILLNSIFSALSNAIGQYDEVDIRQIQNKLLQRITKAMDQEIDQRTEDRDVTFVRFEERITKK